MLDHDTQLMPIESLENISRILELYARIFCRLPLKMNAKGDGACHCLFILITFWKYINVQRNSPLAAITHHVTSNEKY